jgi:hypothetical protein
MISRLSGNSPGIGGDGRYGVSILFPGKATIYPVMLYNIIILLIKEYL